MAANPNAPYMNRGRSSAFWWLSSANHEKCVTCTEKRLLVEKMYPDALNMGLPQSGCVEKTLNEMEIR